MDNNGILDSVYANWTLARIRKSSRICDNGCIEWTAGKIKGGYGQMEIKMAKGVYQCQTAHRALWMATHRVILPRTTQVCHSCDNPPCVNIEHLFLGTSQDNADDKVSKGRHLRRCHGKKNRPHSRIRKFTDADITAMKTETGTNTEIAKKYGTSQSYVSDLRSGKAKKLITPNGRIENPEVIKNTGETATKSRKVYTVEQIQEIKSYDGDWRRRAWEIGMSESYAWQIRNDYNKRKRGLEEWAI